MTVESGAFGRWLEHKAKAPMNGISALTKESPERFPAPSTLWGHSEKVATCDSEEGSTGTCLIIFQKNN